MTREEGSISWRGRGAYGDHDIYADDCVAVTGSTVYPAFKQHSQNTDVDSTSIHAGLECSKHYNNSSSHSSSSSSMVPPPPPPPVFMKPIIVRSKTENNMESFPPLPITIVPPPPLPPSFRRSIITSSTHQPPLPVSYIPPPPLPPSQPLPPPSPPRFKGEMIRNNEAESLVDIRVPADSTAVSDLKYGSSEILHCETESYAYSAYKNVPVSVSESVSVFEFESEQFEQFEQVNTTTIASTTMPVKSFTSATPVVFGQWTLVEDVPPPVEVVEVGIWERHTKGIGGKLLERMGYIRGLGLGKTAQGRLDPVEAATCRGLGQIEEVEGLGLETDDGINQNNISGTKKPFGDALFTNIKTKPEGSGGFKKKKTAHSSGKEETEKRGTVFDFLNKIPSSSSSVDLRKKTGTGTKSAVLPRKEIKKITAKSAF